MTTRVEQKMLSVNFAFVCGQVAKLANAPALGADGAILESSSLSLPTRKSNNSGKNKSVDTICFSKFVAVYVALRKKCCNVERVCIEKVRLLGHWLDLGFTHQINTYPLLHIFQQYQHTFFKINMYALVGSFCNKCNKCINVRHLLMQHVHCCILNLIRIRTV